ncbi:hypothetical protein HRR83_008658 [Exophiala dermatitidis]|uniref:Uncharacterized protein n=1 Tax=Exophiala dermatitidis TaxID=5970 RepID=A0AAN6ES14_EXODE|nr:hypothetical protein HRR75_007874 [Exophiala dermatitidis]KAJ4505200.1 hypothetical protein HRR73_008473 [Exophiala dermatitidis]KAJ4505659.1 hypothetical protein HRR74_008570 [Exophiala dermatitidis]KAJ4536416.1 hypothetical protein HRR77_007335 [Exophiala dermatitidis]KAJ4538659.1 hypothetical protein HRR78_007996 [Exophiala dermatitidis]
MAPWLRLAALPASVLALIVATATTTAAQHNPDWDWQWLYNLPPDAKYYPEDEVVIKRDIAIQQKLQRSGATVTGVRKMSGDPGEKFYLDYWGFAPETEEEEYDEVINRANNATLALLDAAVRVKRDAPRAKLHLPGWHLFQKRGFQCPSGTTACTSIDRPNSCCATDSTCQLVTDTGLGDVGCCAHGQVCAGSLSTCADGYTSCPNNPGGGCCIPGYACYDVGCVQTSTATLVSTPTPTETQSPSQTQTQTQPPSTTTVTSYTTITPSPSPTTASESSSSSSTSISTSTSTPTTTLTPEIITITKTGIDSVRPHWAVAVAQQIATAALQTALLELLPQAQAPLQPQRPQSVQPA